MPQRLDEIDEQHDARVRRAVPGLVLIGVVENHRFAFPPAIDVFLDADAQFLARLRHDQAEMQPQHAVIGPAMRRQVLARLQDREHHRDQAGDFLAMRPKSAGTA